MKIFITENLINGKKYIGKQAHGFASYLGSGILLKKALKKYGKENFKKEYLDTAATKEELSEKEIYWIGIHDAVKSKMFYNLAPGGQGGDNSKFIDFSKQIGKKIHSEEYKKALSKKMMGDLNPMAGKTHTIEAKAKIAAANKGKKRTFSKEHCENLRIAQLNKGPVSKETKSKMSATRTGSRKAGVAIQHVTKTGVVINTFESIRDASNKLSIPYRACHALATMQTESAQNRFGIILKRKN